MLFNVFYVYFHCIFLDRQSAIFRYDVPPLRYECHAMHMCVVVAGVCVSVCVCVIFHVYWTGRVALVQI